MTQKKTKDTEELLYDITNIKSQETYILPSKGLVYDETDNIPASITLRRMTTKEEKIRMRNMSEDTIRKDLLQACIIEPIDAGKLKLMDANFLLFRLRALSLLDDIYKVECYCRNCGTTFIHEIKLSEVPVKYFSESCLDDMKVKLPISGHEIELKYPSLNEMIKSGEKLREYIDSFPNKDRNEAIYTLSAMVYVKNVNNTFLMSEELEDYLDNLDILDNKVFRNAISKIDGNYGLVEDLKTLCPKCGLEITHGLPITGELFNPSL